MLNLAMAGDYFDMKKVASRYYNNGDATKAISIVKRFINKNPKNENAQNLLAVYYYWEGDNKTAKAILYRLLKHSNFPEAIKLMTKILYSEKDYYGANVYAKRFLAHNSDNEIKKIYQKSLSHSKPASKKVASKKRVKKVDHKEIVRVDRKPRIHKRVQKSSSGLPSDLKYMLSKANNNPKDIQSRRILANYYYKKGDAKNALKYAKEALSIKSNLSGMEFIVAKFEKRSPRVTKQSKAAKDILKSLYASNKYAKYINLYNSLVNRSVDLEEEYHMNALSCAINLGEYNTADQIIKTYPFPHNKSMLKLRLLISQKLHPYKRKPMAKL
jgi:Tfp pilus assembly protein PilF